MANIATIGSTSSGHPPFPPITATGGSNNVFAQNKGVHRVGDSYSEHCFGGDCHAGFLASGSSSVFCNSLAVGRVGDTITCGAYISIVDTGITTVNSG